KAKKNNRNFCLQSHEPVPTLPDLSARTLSQPSQISKAINTGAVTIGPAGLQRVTTNQIEADQPKALVGITDEWTRSIAQQIRFATACRTRTCASQGFQFQK